MFSIYLILLLLGTLVSTKTLTGLPNGPLNLTPLLEKGELEKARNLSLVDPKLFDGIKSHAAYFNVNKTGGWNMFFWYLPVQGKPLVETPLIIWLQGGPGCSSLYGLFTEIGPLQLVDGKVGRMPISWGSDYSLLFIDNPVGTGFSYSEGGEYSHDEDSIGLVDQEQADQIHALEEAARQAWDKNNFTEYEISASKASDLLSYYAPVNIYNYIDLTNNSITDVEVNNFLNTRPVQRALHVKEMEYNDCVSMPSLYDDTWKTVKPWLEELLEHYGVMCYKYNNPGSYYYLVRVMNIGFGMSPESQRDLLDNILFDSGQLDLLVAYALSVHTYRSLNWSGKEDYLKADRKPIHDETDQHRVNFFKKSFGNFWDVMVRSAGHMVPGDQPRGAKQMIDLFIKEFK